ncbi:hypothetical protein ACNS7O_16425 (plasmid) [Haloferacaceae archaeon DSL9]
MQRYETHIDGGTVYLETGDGRLEIGDLDTIVDVIGGETYAITYTDRQRTHAWLDTDDDGSMTFDVRAVVSDMSHRSEFVRRMQSIDLSKAKYGVPERTVEFAEEIVSILEQQGSSQAR